jgi:hypothetical protein
LANSDHINENKIHKKEGRSEYAKEEGLLLKF